MSNWGIDGETNFILRIKEQETRLILHERDDDDDDDEYSELNCSGHFPIVNFVQKFRHIYWDRTTSNNAVNQVQVKLP